MEAAPYQYTPLQENEIRLLKIIPGDEDTIVSCRLEHYYLDNPPRYAALSYTWGTDPTRLPILVDGCVLMVTPNLHTALREFRRSPVWHDEIEMFDHVMDQINPILEDITRLDAIPETSNDVMSMELQVLREQIKLAYMRKELIKCLKFLTQDIAEEDNVVRLRNERNNLRALCLNIERQWSLIATRLNQPMLQNYFIWIDALSIDQSNLAERSQQVKLMTDIYMRAGSLIVWLGVLDAGICLGFSALRRFDDEVMQNQNYKFLSDVELSLFYVSSVEWAAIKNILGFSWFTRSWVVQEYALGGISGSIDLKDCVTFCCGNERIADIISILHSVLTLKEKIDSRSFYADYWVHSKILIFGHYRSRLNMMIQQKQEFDNTAIPLMQGGSKAPQFLYLLHNHSLTKATDARDKVYSLLGLAEKLGQKSRMDYLPNDLLLDYSYPIETVYSSCVRSVVLATNRLDILVFGYKEHASQVMSSWTPDWTLQLTPSGRLLLFHELTVMFRDSNRSGYRYDVSPNLECKALFAQDLSTLTVTGFILGDVVLSSNLRTISHDTIASMRQILRGTIHKNLSPDLFATIAGLLITIRDEDVDTLEELDLQTSWSNVFSSWHNLLEKVPLSASSDINNSDSNLEEMERSIFDENPDSRLLHHTIETTMIKSDIFTTSNPAYTLGTARKGVKSGDKVCVFLGCARPMILRPVGGHYELIGEAWVPGIMNGELEPEIKEGKWKMEEFELH